MFRIKKLDGLIIKSFIGPFLITFFVVLVTFVLQFYWLYMDELMGKGFSPWLTIQLLFYTALTIIPMVLPLGILLAAIMTFGNLGENFELVAIKSSGISLYRFMRPLIYFIGVISILAFFFNNYIIPITNLKSYSLLYDMRNQRPAMNIREGIFNKEIDGYAIRVGKKGKDGQTIEDIIIYDHTTGKGNNNIVIAKSGKMYPSPDNKNLIFELNDGWRYEEKREENEQTRMHFGKWYKVFDLSKFAFSRTKEDLFKGNEEMMNVRQINTQIDSMQKLHGIALRDANRYVDPYFSIIHKEEDSIWNASLDMVNPDSLLVYETSFFDVIPDSLLAQNYETAESNLRSMNRLIGLVKNDTKIQGEKINKFKIVWHKKYTLSFACMLLFLIGAPLGAIIRKGGLGMPVIIAIGFFIIYFIISSTGEKLAQQMAVKPWYGMWLATGILLPVAFIIMAAARNDSSIFNRE